MFSALIALILLDTFLLDLGTKRVTKPVSIIIRSYNEEEHIGRLLEGIFEQSVKNIEVIIVDSGSTDKTLRLCQDISGYCSSN